MASTGNYCSIQLLSSATQFCNGPILLSINNPDPGATYQIRKDGNIIATGTSFSATSIGNYDAIITKGTCNATSNILSLTNSFDLYVSSSSDSVCAGGNAILTSIATKLATTYCTPSYSVGTVEGDYISHVSIASTTLSNTTTGAPNPFYTLFPQGGATTATLSANNTYTLSVKGGTFAECYIRGWIDYNQDGLFDPTIESIGVSANVGSQSLGTIVFTIPSGAVNGTTRLRLRSTDDSNGPSIETSCNATNSGYGEAEDYIITINNGVPPFIYSWIETPNGTTLASNNAAQVNASNINQSTTYSATATSGSGCVITSDIVITSKAVSIGSISAAANPICAFGASTVITANNIKGSNAMIAWFSGPKGTGSKLGTGITLASAVANTNYYSLATGSCGDTAEQSITILSDKTPPTITCPANRTANNSNGCSKILTIANPLYSDNCAIKSLTWKMSGATTLLSSSSGIRLIGSKTFNNGISTIIYTINDSNNNKTTCMLTVTLIDNAKPIFNNAVLNIVDSVQSGCSKSISIPAINFSDNCGTPTLSWTMTGATIMSGAGQIGTRSFNVGKTIVTYTITDIQGNKSTTDFTVTIFDKVKPTLSCPSNITKVTDGTNCSKSISIPNPIFSDNCKINSLVWKMTGATVLSSGTTGIKLVGSKTFNAGLTIIEYTITDSSANKNSCIFNVQLNSNGTCPLLSVSKNIISENGFIEPFNVKISPNPSASSFKLNIQSDDNKTIAISIYNASGKKIQHHLGLSSRYVEIGDKFIPGAYLFEVIQGKKRAAVVAVKQ